MRAQEGTVVRRLRLASPLRPATAVWLAAALGLAAALPAAAQVAVPRAPQPVWSTTIVSRAGVPMGRLTIAALSDGRSAVDLTLHGFDPVAGSHRLVISAGARCAPPDPVPAGETLAVLPPVAFAADGSADYHVLSEDVSLALLMAAREPGAFLYADTDPASEIIGCGVLSVAGNAPAPPGGYEHVQTVAAPAGLALWSLPGSGGGVLVILPPGATLRMGDRVLAADGTAWVAAWAPLGSSGVAGWAEAQAFCPAIGCPAAIPTPAATPSPCPPDAPCASGAAYPTAVPYAACLRVATREGIFLRGGPGLAFQPLYLARQGERLQATGVVRRVDGVVWAELRLGDRLLWGPRQGLASC